MGETTETEIKEEKTDKPSYIDVFAIFISIFWNCLVFELWNCQACKYGSIFCGVQHFIGCCQWNLRNCKHNFIH